MKPQWRAGSVLCLVCFAAAASGEDAERVGACQVKKDPAAYNHKLIEVVRHGFEQFDVFDPTCEFRTGIWLEYGGTVSSGTIYCCGVSAGRRRMKPLVVEDVPIPLTMDQRFREFDNLVQRLPDRVVRATFSGRFFAGEPESDRVMPGFGHLGCCSLLAIERVLAVDPQVRADLDYRAEAGSAPPLKVGCSYKDLAPQESGSRIIAAQQQAERESEWALNDAQRVVNVTLAKFLDIDPAKVNATQTKESAGREVFEWRPERQGKEFVIVASRPYWLSLYAKEPQRVAWVVIAAYESSCDGPR